MFIDTSDQKKQEMLEKQFAHGKSILAPLKARNFKTDKLIDEINETKEIFYHKKGFIYPEQGEWFSLNDPSFSSG